MLETLQLIKMDLYAKRDYLQHMVNTSKFNVAKIKANLDQVKGYILRKENRLRVIEENKQRKK